MQDHPAAKPADQAAASAAGASPCLHTLFEAQATARPAAIAVRFKNECVTYLELNERANRIAHSLIAAGVTPDDTVGLCLERSIDLLAGVLGILKAGGAYVPLDPDYPSERLHHVLKQAAPRIVLSRAGLEQALPQHTCTVIDIAACPADTHNPAVAVTGDNLCYLIFTSGSTGQPKGVMVTHHNVARLFSTISTQVPFSHEDVWTLFHSVAFGFSAWEIYGALLHGAELVIVPEDVRADPAALYDLLRTRKVTCLSQTPSAFRQLLLNEAFANSDAELALKTIFFSGEAVVAGDLEQWFAAHKHGPRLLNTYAITETGGQVTVREYSDAHMPPELTRSIGTPLSDTPIYILDAALQLVPTGEIGELCVSGPGLSRGYINQPELTAEKFIEIRLAEGEPVKIYRTGDQARLLSNGEIEFLGRADNQVKVRGYRVEPGDIETCLRRHPQVSAAAVVLRTEGGEARLVAYAVATTTQPTVSELREFVAASLPDYMVPAVFVFLDALPLNPNGKLDRAALPVPGNARPALANDYVAPATDLTRKLEVIWARALMLDKVGLHDNFFALGGDSILALKLTSALRELLGDYIYISALLEAPSIAELADYLEREHAAAVAGLAAGSTTQTEALPAVIPDAAARFETFELTDIQQAYLVGRGSDFSMGNVSTHLYIEVDAHELDLPRLEQAWQQVIDRHPMLRAIVLPDGLQQILPDVPPYRFPVQDLRELNAEGVEEGLQRERDRLSHQVIPSDRWPLFELSASLMPNDKTRVHISLDCLITDARSFQIMSAELLTFYHDPAAVLPVPGVSFRDYVITEHQLRDTPFYNRALDYWRERLKTLPAMPQLTLARAPETLEEHRFSQRGIELPQAEWDRFQARASNAGITPTAALLQCFGETLAAWSRAPRLTLNLTLFNRMPLHPDVENVVGDFTSLVLVGVDELHAGGFEARAQRLQKELWQGVDNRFVSGVRVLREMAQLGDKVQPMMPIVFTSTLGIGSGGQDSSSWHHLGEQVFSVSQTPQVWIDHVASERDGALWYTWDVVDELFPPGMIDAMFAAYSARLRQLASDEAAWHADWVDTLTQLLPPAQQAVRTAANATAAPEPTELLHAGFLRNAEATPDAPAVIATDRSLSYTELDMLSNQLAQQLQAQGVSRNELVAVVMQKGWEQIVAVLGILKAGAAYMPVDAAMPTERLHYLLEFGEVRVAVTQVCQDAAIEWPAATVRLRISDTELAAAATNPVANQTQLNDIAYVIFTSGSTGQPKGVVIDHRGATNTCKDINQRFSVGPEDRVLALSSLSFDLSVYDIFGVLDAGGTIVMPDAGGMRDPSHWATLVARHRVSIWNTVPALMDLLTDYAEQQVEPILDSLRVVMMSGDWIPVKLPGRIRALGAIDVYSLGGATEASIWSIIYPIGNVPSDWISIPYGKPMLNQTFHVLNSDLTPCPDWVPGELYIGGIGVALGYWRDEAKTAASFITHPHTGERLYRTGDLGRYLPDGNIEFMGREDFQVKIQGFRVELGDIEAALEAHPDVRHTVVVAVGDGPTNKRLVAYLVAESSPAPASDELRTWLGKKLPEYMVPSAFVLLDALPLTANGKVDRRELPAPPSLEGERAATTAASSDAANIDVGRIVAEVLGAGELDPATNLLQMGATSIEMIRVANALDQQLGFRPRMDDFYRDPSVNGLTLLLAQQQPAAAEQETAGGDPLQTPRWLLAGIDKIMDPDERNAFKASRPALRHFAADAPRVKLAPGSSTEDDYLRHRSYREFADTELPIAEFSKLLGCLQSIQLNDNPKYLYASAGGLYPVQTYVYVKPGRIAGLAGGAYYHDPELQQLVLVSPASDAVREIYDPLINRPIFDTAAFSLFLVAELASIGAMYQERALHYSTLEAGHMTQLLEMRAPDFDIGLCQIGGLETADLGELLQLADTQLVLHGLLGGGISASSSDAPAARQATASDERDEGEI